MKNKKIIIALLAIFAIFAIVLGIIVYKRFSPNNNDKIDTPNQPQYAVNDIKTDEDTEDTGEESQESQTYILDNITISNINKLTPEQNADKLDMFNYVQTCAKSENRGDIVSEEILDNSTEFDIYIRATFADNTSADYVCLYDPTSQHSFLRCIPADEWTAIQSGVNAG